VARHRHPGRRLLPRPDRGVGTAEADGRLSGPLAAAPIALTWQDGYNDAVAQIAPTPALNVAHAGSVYAMLFSATSFSAVTCATRVATSLTLQAARRCTVLPRLHAAGAGLPTGTAEEPVQLEAMTATLGARLCPWVYVRSSLCPACTSASLAHPSRSRPSILASSIPRRSFVPGPGAVLDRVMRADGQALGLAALARRLDRCHTRSANRTARHRSTHYGARQDRRRARHWP